LDESVISAIFGKKSSTLPDSTKGFVVQLKLSRVGWRPDESSKGTTH
jgi:hypothetical protein